MPLTRKYLILLSFCGAIFVLGYSCKTHYKAAGKDLSILKRPSDLINGKNLTYTICGECHYNEAVQKFMGNPFNNMPGIMGRVYGANLTHSKMYGAIQKYTDEQLAYLLKTGITNTGRFIPYMMRPTMADADISDIIAYLRSDDAAVAAADTIAGKTHLNFIGRLAIHTRKPQPYIEGLMRPDANDAIANGRYLVDVIGCYHCHSKSVVSLNYMHPERSKKYMQGGEKFKSPEGKVHASNLTADKETGVGLYTKEAFRKALRTGETPQGDTLAKPMPRFPRITDKQADDIFVYLQTLPVKHPKEKK